MTPDDAHTSHNHGFELPEAPQVVVRSNPRPWRAVAGVAVCLGLAGIVTGLIVARRQSTSDARLLSDALQREELRDGWKALGAAAARDAELNRAPASPPESATATAAAAAPPNVVIVNVPAANAPSAPPNVTNINLPNGEAAAPTARSTVTAGEAANISLPPINFSPVPGYLPMPTGYTAPPASPPPQTGVLPLYSYGTNPSSVPPLTPAVGNGSIPGSTPNPALPNNGLVGTPALPGQPNSVGGSATPSAPIGATPISPSTPSLPSGFSVP